MKTTKIFAFTSYLVLSPPSYSATAVADSSVTQQVVAPAFAGVASVELQQLQSNITLGDWRKTHPSDSLIFFQHSFEEPSNEEWCVIAQRNILLSPSRQVATRRAYFYIPMPPPGLILPRLCDSAEIRVTQPVLGMLWIEMIERSTQASAIIADSLSARLSTWLGAPKIDPEMYYYRAAGWGRRNRWQQGNAIFASARGVTPEYDQPPRVSALGFLPISNVHIDLDYKDLDIGGIRLNQNSIIFERTLGYLPGHNLDARELTTMFHQGQAEAFDSLNGARALTGLRRWFDIFSAADNRTLAAALLLADQVLHVCERTLDTAAVRQLRGLGATLTESRTMGWIYERSWLMRALALDNKGPIGEMALMILIQHGFQIQADCHDCGQCFGRVILEGEKFLLRTRDPQFVIWTNIALGCAYSDVVALANGIESVAAEDSGIQLTANAARFKAVEHFRQAIAIDNDFFQARQAWRDSWRLIAGIPPETLHFTCSDE
jgi:hypothetical protein